ncbi:MAG: HEAT repeat domain-containing protein [Gemmatimonadota bacterium]|nr:MAG: HEAT repeat domain-containing protein [Gemmatimonadota bacterium]
MKDEHKIALLMARMVDLLRRNPGAVDDQKAALRSLLEVVNQRSFSARVQGHRFAVEGSTIPPEVPFVSELVSQLRAHGVGEVIVAQGTPALDLMHLFRAVADQPGAGADGSAIVEALAAAGIRRIAVVELSGESPAESKREARVTDAVAAVAAPEETETEQEPQAFDIIPEHEGAGFTEMMERTKGRPVSPTAAARSLRRPGGAPETTRALKEVAVGVSRAIQDGRTEEAVEALMKVLREESEVADDQVREAYQIAWRGLLNPEVLRPLSKLLIDPLYGRDIINIMRRAGTKGTQLLMDQLIAAPTFAERRAYLEALRQVQEGTDIIVNMLGHHEWYVVRNVADLVGELAIEEAIPALGKVVEHKDARVRLAAGVALAKIGTPHTVRYLRPTLHDRDPRVRASVAREMGGSGLSALVMPLINAIDAEEVDEVRGEYYRALGRIGSPDAIAALKEVARKTGGLFRSRGGTLRVAAVQGLAIAGGEEAKRVLESLKRDRDKEVRDASLSGLRSIEKRNRLPS